MIATLAFLFLAKQKLDSSFDAIWNDMDGNVLILRSKKGTECQMKLGDRLIRFAPPQQVPDGDFVQAWVGQRTLSVQAIYQTFTPMELIKPETDADFGEVRIGYGKADASGVIRTLAVQIKDGNGAKKINDLFYYCAPLSRLNLTGTYSGPHRKLEINETEATGNSDHDADFVGKVSYDDSTYVISGHRYGSRAVFQVVGADYDNVAGYGYCVWLPTDSRARKIMNRDEKQTDQILLYLRIKDLPNGGQALLKPSSGG